MPGGGVAPVVHGTADAARIEAPVTVKAYLMCAFAAFGGIFFGYDTGWMGGVLAMVCTSKFLLELVALLQCSLQLSRRL